MKRNLVKMEEHVKMVSPATSALALLDSMEKIVKTVSQFVTSFLFVYKFFIILLLCLIFQFLFFNNAISLLIGYLNLFPHRYQ